MVWYLLRSTGSFRAASARAAASEIGVPLRLAALSCLSAPGLGVAGAAGLANRSPEASFDLAFASAGDDAPLLLPASASTSDGSTCEYSATRRVRVENFIAFRNEISLRASGSCTARSSS